MRQRTKGLDLVQRKRPFCRWQARQTQSHRAVTNSDNGVTIASRSNTAFQKLL
jgi:hypothetical protein